jgi:L-fucose isomerase-like protein
MTATAPLLALCPMGKFVFSNEDAIRQKQLVQARLRAMGVRFTDLDGVLPDGLVKDQTHVATAVAHFKAQGADALFMPHCNFGTEGACGMIARHLGLPVLLWSPRDAAPQPDGSRLRDSLCGTFASSKVLRRLGIPFSYIGNCAPEAPEFAAGVDRFVRAANVAGAFRTGMRIGQIGNRIDFFWTTIINEGELLDRFKVEVLPIDMATFIKDAQSRAGREAARYRVEAAGLRRTCTVEGFPDDQPLINILAVRDEMLFLAEKHGCDALAVQDFTSLVDAMGAYCFFATSLVSERLPVSLETDIHGAISLVLMQRANLGAAPVHLTEFTNRHPSDENAVLLWHAGAPVSYLHPDQRIRLGHHWILPSPLAGMTHFRLRDGDITVARFDGDRGEYRLAVGQGRSVPGPDTLNNWTWMQVNDWPQWERTLIEGPYIHHIAMAYGQVGDALAEAVRFIPGLAVDRLGEG